MKHALWAIVAIAGLMLAAAAFLAHAPTAAQEAQASAVSFTPIATGKSATDFGRVDYRITSSEDLARLWKMLGASSTPPMVDFSQQEVLAVFASAPVKVASVEDAASRTVVVQIRSCGAASSTAYEIVAVPSTTLPLTHEDSVAGC